jgi:hypothetical protein
MIWMSFEIYQFKLIIHKFLVPSEPLEVACKESRLATIDFLSLMNSKLSKPVELKTGLNVTSFRLETLDERNEHRSVILKDIEDLVLMKRAQNEQREKEECIILDGLILFFFNY